MAEEHGLNVSRFVETMRCESSGFKNAAIQSSYTKPDGTPERSYGVAQWNLDYNPEITYKEATDPQWALEAAAKEWEDGHASKWSCYRTLFIKSSLGT